MAGRYDTPTFGTLIGSGDILNLVRSRPGGLTKTELSALTGLSRTTINQRLEPLVGAGLLVASVDEARTGGRPADRFSLDERYGVVLVADMGASGLRVALCDMNAQIRAEQAELSDVASGPRPVLDRVADLFDALLESIGLDAEAVRGVGVDVPGPVDHATGRVITPPIMTGWHDFDIVGHIDERFDCPVVVEKDTNAMAFGEHRLSYRDVADLVFVKIGTGIGTGIIVEGQIYRGADGAAGDVGHIQIDDDEQRDQPLCKCGRFGCVEAYAGGWALLRDLREAGVPVESVGDVVRVTREGHPEATRRYRRASMILGKAVSDVVNVLNPRIVVIGGQLAEIDDVLFATVREVVYRRSLPLATRRLQIVPSGLGARGAGVNGLARLVLDHVYSPSRVDGLLAHAQPG